MINNKKMDNKQQIEQLFIENQWSILENFTDIPIEGKIENYDISGIFFLRDFEFNIFFLKEENIIICKIFRKDRSTFSSLRIYSEKPLDICNLIINKSKFFSEEKYIDFVKEIYYLSDRLIFNNNGVWIKIDF